MNRLQAGGAVAALAIATGPIPAAQASEELGGYEASGMATPMAVWVYEPTVPGYSKPEAELNLAYTAVRSSTGPSSRALASLAWPGPLVGDGFGLIMDGLGVPLKKYPLMADSSYPGSTQRRSEPAPGVVQRTRTTEAVTEARASMVSAEGGETEEAAVPSPGTAADISRLAAGTGAPNDMTSPARAALAAVVQAENVTSSSKIDHGSATVVSTASSSVSGLALLGGLLTVEEVGSSTRASSSASKADGSGETTVTNLALAGRKLLFDGREVRFADQSTKLPALPDQAGKALREIGIELESGPVEKSVKGSEGRVGAEGLVVRLDTRRLRAELNAIPFERLLGLMPEQGDELRSHVETVLGLGPEIVLHLGRSEASTSGATPVTLPQLPALAPPGSVHGATGSSATPAGSAGGSVSGGTAATSPTAGGAPAAAPPAGAGQPTRAVAGRGLPPLGSIPGVLLISLLLLALAIGLLLQKLGGAMLGGVVSCSHGLDSGIPDLRKD